MTSIHDGAGKPPLLFALHGSSEFGQRIGRHLGLEPAAHEEREFEDGEHKTRPVDEVQGRQVFVVHALHADRSQSGNDKLCRLLFFIGALKDAGAARVTAVVPYLAYARKDRRTRPQDGVATRYVAQLFEAVGTDAIVTIDVHNSAAFDNAFRIPAQNLEAAPLFVAELLPVVGQADVVVVSPDAGGMKRAERLRELLAQRLDRPVGIAFAEKHRSEQGLSGDLLVGDVGSRLAILFDDLISTGATLVRAARACRAAGARSVIACATHGAFAEEANTVLADAALDRIIVTDTVPPWRLESEAVGAKLSSVSCAGLFATLIGAT
ncbi:ribose-phosphate pyrophosphokinase [Noviherbaspirillum humi]|uniref:ribose-phosphate diphosphokinase n=1 Tax=Noviherbaspirillum humi TaxID=1688639 RepID=A0A239FE47_9BURK|nr:ribose-phosphate diphosphokinase [Noviherbaspirillum humi]SNS55021.1 ribose-phosphate pyrophosphokinase [Noviherbaspirillum humi]